MKKILAAGLVALALVGCGPDNVGACKKFVTAVNCGTQTLITESYCDAYKNVTCDITEYFNCLTPKYVCKDGNYDTTALASIGECSSKAVCK